MYVSSLVDVKHYSKGHLQTGCVLRSDLRPEAAPERLHQLYWCTIIPLALKVYDKKGAYLQMGNQFDLHIRSHGKLLDAYTCPALERCH